jgi:CRP/FNR family transcriptional regulator, dissimilatory nitrate respiration regulator
MSRPIPAEAFLASLPLFKGLPVEELARLAAGTTKRQLERGEALFLEGEPSTGLHALLYGRIKLFTRGADGRERVIEIVGPGRSFGEPVMFLEKPYIVSAVALADTLALHVARETILAELERNPRLAARLIGAVAERTEALMRELREYAEGSGAQRFARWLLRQPMRVDEAGTATVTLPAAKRLLAARLKISAEHLSRVLRELSIAGLIGVRGRDVTIPDVERLREQLGQAPRP